MKRPTLEPAAQQIAEATSKPPFLYDLGPEGARKVLDDIQAAPVPKLDVDEKWITVPASAAMCKSGSSSLSAPPAHFRRSSMSMVVVGSLETPAPTTDSFANSLSG